MNLLYVPSDQKYLDKRGMRTLFWLDDLGAIPLSEHPGTEEGFLFSYARHIDDYRQLVESLPLVRDRPEEREPLLALDKTLDRLAKAGIDVPMPKTWRIGVDDRLPQDLSFPLFLRTVESSWKVAGEVSRVRTEKQFSKEAEQLRRTFGWNVPIMAREWLDLAAAGESVYGRVPQEIRTWSVDGKAVAWSFHHLHPVPRPKGLPCESGTPGPARPPNCWCPASTSGLAWLITSSKFKEQRNGSPGSHSHPPQYPPVRESAGARGPGREAAAGGDERPECPK
jgi:hypothetical protein